MKLKMASDEDIERYWRMAKRWSAQQEWKYYCEDRFCSQRGIVEFLANQAGTTAFLSYVGRDYSKVE